MGSLQSAILGYGIFKVLKQLGLVSGFSIAENVIVQTTSVATATMPLAGLFSRCLCPCTGGPRIGVALQSRVQGNSLRHSRTQKPEIRPQCCND